MQRSGARQFVTTVCWQNENANERIYRTRKMNAERAGSFEFHSFIISFQQYQFSISIASIWQQLPAHVDVTSKPTGNTVLQAGGSPHRQHAVVQKRF